MSLVKAIKFRFLIAQLTQTEVYQFTNKLLNQNASIITTALFHAMIAPSNVNIQPDDINSSISNIIQSRKTKPKPIPTQNIKMDQIPKQLIGIIASFLSQNDYANFSQANRWISIGCNSPNLLQNLDIVHKDVSSINLSLYPSVKSLAFDINKVNELQQLSTFNQLKFVTLHAYKCKTHHFDALINASINTDRVLQLTLENASNSASRTVCTVDQFNELLKKFPNIQYLTLEAAAQNIQSNEIKRLCPNLKGFAAYCSRQTNETFINSFANNLEYLSLPSMRAYSDFELNKLNFSNLKQLALFRPNVKTFNDMIQTAKNLKQIFVKPSVRQKRILTLDETQEVMSKLITRCTCLEYIEFVDDGTLMEAALNGIENGLCCTKVLKRRQMKIRIHLIKPFSSESLVLAITKVINCLESSEIIEFMFIMNGFGDSNGLQDLKDNLASHVEVKRDEHDVIVITNKDCRMNGYSEKWKLINQYMNDQGNYK